jgi:hypothetical protein
MLASTSVNSSTCTILKCDDEGLKTAAGMLRDGRCVAFPTGML